MRRNAEGRSAKVVNKVLVTINTHVVALKLPEVLQNRDQNICTSWELGARLRNSPPPPFCEYEELSAHLSLPATGQGCKGVHMWTYIRCERAVRAGSGGGMNEGRMTKSFQKYTSCMCICIFVHVHTHRTHNVPCAPQECSLCEPKF